MTVKRTPRGSMFTVSQLTHRRPVLFFLIATCSEQTAKIWNSTSFCLPSPEVQWSCIQKWLKLPHERRACLFYQRGLLLIKTSSRADLFGSKEMQWVVPQYLNNTDLELVYAKTLSTAKLSQIQSPVSGGFTGQLGFNLVTIYTVL